MEYSQVQLLSRVVMEFSYGTDYKYDFNQETTSIEFSLSAGVRLLKRIKSNHLLEM